MRIGSFLKIMAVVTIMAVLYIHLQLQIYALAYQGKKREISIDKMAERNALVQNDILRMKSSDHIGRKLLASEKDYRFAGKGQVVEVEESAAAGGNKLALERSGNMIGQFMTLAFTPAEAVAGR